MGAKRPVAAIAKHQSRRGAWSAEAPENGAGDGVRTRDPELGKLVLYQLSYTRNADAL